MALRKDRPTLKELLEQLVEVSEWEQLAAHLGVKKYKLNEIRESRRGVTANCKMDMFDYWLRSDIRASWKKVVETLEKMDYGGLATNMRVRHGLAPAPLADEPMEQDTQPRRQPVSMGPSAGNGSRSGVRETMAVPVSDTGTQESSNIGETVSALTRDDSDLDIVNIIEPSENKISILQKAILRRAINMAKVLIALGADVNYINQKNSTPLDTALMIGDGNVIELIKSVGGTCASQLNSEKASSAFESDDEMRSLSGSLVLCLDSSSEKALVQLEILNRIEKLTGKKVSELFEYMVGSGIGGLMLLAMVYAKKSVRQVQRLYYQYMQRLLSLPNAKKKWRELENFTHDLFHRTRMEDEEAPKVLIGSVNKENTALKLKFFTNFSKDRDSSLHVYKVACYTCATSEYYDVIGLDTDHYIHGGAICRNLTPSALSFIQENCGKPSIFGVVSVGEGVWSSSRFTEDTDLSVCAMDALVELVHQNCKSQFSPPSATAYYRINPIFPAQTPVNMVLSDLIDLHVTTIASLVDKSSYACVEIESLACHLNV